MLRVFGGVAWWLGRILLAFLVWFVFAQTVLRLVRRYWHFPAPPFVSVYLNSPLRKAIQPPSEVVAAAGVDPGMTVLELGCGPGTFTLEAARVVGATGRVVAVDIQPKMIDRLGEAVRQAGIDNVEIRLADAYNLPAADESVDVALAVTVLAEVPDRQRALAELKRVLRPEGVLSISEMLLDPDYPRQSTVILWCEEAGFRLEEAYPRGMWYLLSFRKG
jgi:ubiquinone/menaquinone biosynthesis C-methylase UbiE